jgi:hypothetical protein
MSGYTSDGNNNAINTDENKNISNGMVYTFSVTVGGTPYDADTFHSWNKFNKLRGVWGQVTEGPSGVPDRQVKLFKGSTLVGSTFTNAEGFYYIASNHKGSAAEYTVQVVDTGAGPNYTSQPVTLKTNYFREVNFIA